MNLFVIETTMPDGVYWYGGIRKQQRTTEKGTGLIVGAEWSPYWEDRKEFNFEQANLTFTAVCASMPGCKIVQVNDANKREAWKTVNGNPNAWEFRAKYLSIGLIIKMPGYTGYYRVTARNHKEFTLARCQANGNTTSMGGDVMYIGVNSEKTVIVTGQKTGVGNEASNN